MNPYKISSFLENKKIGFWMIFIFVCLIPIALWRDYTPANELRYISIADEALRNHTWFSLTNHGVPYSDKPPFYFWLIMLCKLITDEYHMGILILYSLIPALGICYTMAKWSQNMMGESCRASLPLFLITTGYFAGTAMVLRMDMLMVWFIVLALYHFHQMYEGKGSLRKHQVLMAIYIILGFYAKAFMGILIPLVSSLVFLVTKKEGRSFFKYWNGWVWTIIIGGIALWFGMVYIEAGGEYLYNLTVGQTVSRSVKVSVHKKPFYYYIIFLSYGIAPWTLFYVISLIEGIKKRLFQSSAEHLFLVVILTTFVMLSCFGSKLAIYLVPIFPFMACLALIVLERCKWNKLMAASISLPAIATVLAFPAYLIVAYRMPEWHHPSLYIATALLSCASALSINFAWRSKRLLTAAQLFCIGFLLTAFVGGFSLQKFNPTIGYTALAKEAQKQEKEWNCNGIATFGVWRAENMDVFFPDRLNVVTQADSLTLPKYEGKLLIVKEKKLKDKKVKLIVSTKPLLTTFNGYVLVKL